MNKMKILTCEDTQEAYGELPEEQFAGLAGAIGGSAGRFGWANVLLSMATVAKTRGDGTISQMLYAGQGTLDGPDETEGMTDDDWLELSAHLAEAVDVAGWTTVTAAACVAAAFRGAKDNKELIVLTVVNNFCRIAEGDSMTE